MAKIIVFTTRNIYPTFGGEKERIFSIISCLPKGNEIVIYYLSKIKNDPETITLGNANIIKLIPIYHSLKNILFDNHLLNWLKYPLQVNIYQNRMMLKKVIENDLDGNILIFHLFRSWQFYECKNAYVWLELTDLISKNYSKIRLRDYISYPKNIFYRSDLKRIVKLEKNLVKKVDVCTLISRIEAEQFKCSNPLQNISYLPLIYTKTKNEGNKPEGTKICIIGNFKSVQNQIILQESLNYFRLIKSAISGASLKIVGNVPKHLQARNMMDDHVEFVGIVDNVGDAISDCKFGLCPLIQGAGVQNKILDYIASGVIPIANSKAVREFQLCDRKDYIDLNGADWISEMQRCAADNNLFKRYLFEAKHCIDTYSTKNGRVRLENLLNVFCLEK